MFNRFAVTKRRNLIISHQRSWWMEITHVSEDGSLLSVRYGEDCTVLYERQGKKRGALLAINEGIEVARNDDLCSHLQNGNTHLQ